MSNTTGKYCPITKRWEQCCCCIAEYCKRRVDYIQDREDDWYEHKSINA